MNKFYFYTSLVLIPYASLLSDTGQYKSHISLAHHEGDGIGFKYGYTSVSAFLTPQIWESPVRTFTDLRMHFSNSGRELFNGGIGFRYPLYENRIQFGLNAYYDFRRCASRAFHQVGFGSEWLSRELDLRFNVYLPLGHTERIHRSMSIIEPIAAQTCERGRAAVPALDLEIGRYFHGKRLLPLEVYAGFGTYHLFKKRLLRRNFADVWGVQGRLSFRLLPGVRFRLSGSWDSQYKGRLLGGIYFGTERSGGLKHLQDDETTCDTGEGRLESKVSDFPYRREVIPCVSHKRKKRIGQSPLPPQIIN